ncbi:MAG TPA: hypothetical protein VFE58_17460, partial [Tepidisphaeraceae bacterium]|nr:hypothetical protein [Tepidisphaeraceae bacterium]
LHDCPPPWVRRISLGTGLLAVSTLLLSCPTLLNFFFNGPSFTQSHDYFFRQSTPSSSPLLTFLYSPTAPILLFGICLLIQLPGVFLVTGHEPGGSSSRLLWTRSWRILTLLSLASVPLDYFFLPTFNPANWTLQPTPFPITLLSAICHLSYSLCPAIGFWHLRYLTIRIGRPKLAEYAAIVGAALSTLLLTYTLMGIQQSLSQFARYANYNSSFWLFQIVAQNRDLLVFFLPPLLILLATTRRALRSSPKHLAPHISAFFLYLLAAIWGTSLAKLDAHQPLWQITLTLGLLIATTLTFYPWALLVLTRTSLKLFQTATQAQSAWHRADASLSR